MNLKTFDEFKASLTKEDLDYIYGVNDENENHLETTLSDPQAFTKMAAFTASFSFKMSMRLLELYHKWISEQLEK